MHGIRPGCWNTPETLGEDSSESENRQQEQEILGKRCNVCCKFINFSQLAKHNDPARSSIVVSQLAKLFASLMCDINLLMQNAIATDTISAYHFSNQQTLPGQSAHITIATITHHHSNHHTSPQQPSRITIATHRTLLAVAS